MISAGPGTFPPAVQTARAPGDIYGDHEIPVTPNAFPSAGGIPVRRTVYRAAGRRPVRRYRRALR